MLDLVNSLSNNQADPLTSEVFYGEVVLDLAQLPLFVDATLVSVGVDQGTNPDGSYTFPDAVIRPLQWYYSDTILNEARETELINWNQNWRAMQGLPIALYRSDVGARRFRLVPQPDVDTEQHVGPDPLGADYPDNAVVIMHTVAPQDLPEYMDLVIAYFILAREFARESNHQDMAYSQVCAKLANGMLEMVK